MDITRSTVWGSILLLLLTVALFTGRAHLLTRREDCRRQLLQLVPRLDAYAAAHQGQLPATPEAFDAALGALPHSTIEHQPFRMNTTPLRWKSGSRHPYLWDAGQHPFVNGMHVLYTDGTVAQVGNPKEMGQ